MEGTLMTAAGSETAGGSALVSTVDEAIARLEAQRGWWENAAPAEVSQVLRALAATVAAHEDELVDLAVEETHLASPKLHGEIARTVNQLRMFADVGESGAFWEVVIDHADPSLTPPRPDLRKVMRPVGVVGVFAASNFPFAFGIPGGDVASALVARCPVLVRAHPAQPRLGERIAELIEAMFEEHAVPCVLEVVGGADLALGHALVEHPLVKAIGFTGSRGGGLALASLAAARPVPIPVYAEMGSVNPVLITPGALAEDETGLVELLAGSLSIGHGQMCTKPGVVAVPASPSGDRFVEEVVGRLATVPSAQLLHGGMSAAVMERVAEDRAEDAVALLLDGALGVGQPVGQDSTPSLGFTVSMTELAQALERPELVEEVFGPYALFLRYQRPEDFVDLLAARTGELTVSVQISDGELAASWVSELVEVAAKVAGRVVWNGMPTGVAPVNAMHHGGPFPASSDAAHTAVGAGAVRRFLRPVTFQDAPAAVLPPPAQENNPWGVPQLIDHQWLEKKSEGER